jgi:hypothetical protein
MRTRIAIARGATEVAAKAGGDSKDTDVLASKHTPLSTTLAVRKTY